VAVNTWSSGGSTDMNLGANWSLGALNATDDLVFDNTSVVNSTATAPIDCATFTINVTYTGALNDGGFAFTISGAVALNSGGTFTATGTWTQDTDASFSFTSTGAATTTAWSIDLQGTGTLSLKGGAYNQLTCAAAGKTTTSSSPGQNNFSRLVTSSGAFVLNNDIALLSTANNAFAMSSSCTWSGNASFNCHVRAAGLNLTVGAFTYSGTGIINFLFSSFVGASSMTQTGNIIINNGLAASFRIYGFAANQTATYNTGGFSISSQGTFYLGQNSATSTFTFNPGSSLITCFAYNSIFYNAGLTTLNASTSTWAVSGDFDLGTNTTWVAGTSIITFTGNNACTLTSAGQTLSEIIVNKGASGVTLSDALTCGDLTLTDGTFDMNGFACSCTDFTLNTADATTFNALLSITGNAAFNRTATFAQIQGAVGSVFTFNVAMTVTVTAYVPGDLDGVVFASGTPGTRAALVFPIAGVTIDNATATDIDSSAGGVVDATTGGTDGGNNLNWLFPAPGPGVGMYPFRPGQGRGPYVGEPI
jgi:hypothetical protein